MDIEAKERKSLYQALVKSGNFDFGKFNEESKKLGIIVFESNSRLSLENVYTIYLQRWVSEEAFKFYKGILELPKTAKNYEYCLYATEFINYISLIILTRVKNEFARLDLSKTYSFNQIINYLRSYKKQSDDGLNWRNSKLLDEVEKIVDILAI
ncbi:hypothetical protein NPA07_00355 [Mycoplasmopsis caviae]|uniref:Uncharacterized protein n=1 Tax=Mycoplasmopsis caviae TaxID=55603 RepID=A0A3P8KBE3_9BACT|nr:hypothetical protein [Mycoplasmopsis caviae]UUD35317.1 hypothetical protein NPA07_00355 [Mycoplasmopsis caviae]VDR41904.1 Uncharacterised protein [Mycoplasmopsis caviae]